MMRREGDILKMAFLCDEENTTIDAAMVRAPAARMAFCSRRAPAEVCQLLRVRTPKRTKKHVEPHTKRYPFAGATEESMRSA